LEKRFGTMENYKKVARRVGPCSKVKSGKRPGRLPFKDKLVKQLGEILLSSWGGRKKRKGGS